MGLFTLTAGMKSLLKHWGTIRAAANQRAGVATTRQMLTTLGVFDAPGETEPTWQEYQAVYGLAVQNRTAAANLNRAALTAAVDASMIGLSPNARTPAAMAAAPQLELRVGYTVTATGTEIAAWTTIKISTVATLTVQDLFDTATTAITQNLLTVGTTPTTFGATLTSIDSMTLVAR